MDILRDVKKGLLRLSKVCGELPTGNIMVAGLGSVMLDTIIQRRALVATESDNLHHMHELLRPIFDPKKKH